jgi:hypothetical protein
MCQLVGDDVLSPRLNFRIRGSGLTHYDWVWFWRIPDLSSFTPNEKDSTSRQERKHTRPEEWRRVEDQAASIVVANPLMIRIVHRGGLECSPPLIETMEYDDLWYKDTSDEAYETCPVTLLWQGCEHRNAR